MRRDGHDAGDDGDVDAGEITAFAEVEEVVVVEEELGADVVRAGVDFLLQVIHLEKPVGRFGVSFWEASDSDPERVVVAGVKVVDVADEISSVGKGVF